MTETKKRLGFIGLGAMGKPMAQNIAKRLGVAISIYDINATVMTNSYEWGGIICSTPAEVAESSDIVFSMLPADENLLAVALGEDGIIDSLRGGLTLVDFSTLGPATIHTIDKKFGELGAHCLSAAVTLGVPRAIEGTLSIYVDMDVYEDEDIMAFVQGCAATVIPIGNRGSAKIIKLVNNFLTGVGNAAIAEVIALGVKAGVPLETLLTLLLKGSAASFLMEKDVTETVPTGDLGPGRFSTDFMIKDLKLVQELAQQLGHPTHFSATALTAYNGSRAYGHGSNYVGSIIRWYEVAANMNPVASVKKV